MNELIYFAAKKKAIYRQCLFSVLSIINRFDILEYKIVIYTDNSKFFKKQLKYHDKIEYVSISKNQMNEWIGSEQCIYLAKLHALHNSLKRADKSIFIDTDTYFIDNPCNLFYSLTNNNCIFYTNEGTFNSNINKRWKIIQNHINQNNFEFDNSIIKIKNDSSMYNVGVIGLTSDNSYIIQEAIRLTNQFCEIAKAEAYYPEQSILSILCAIKLHTQTATKTIYHYCYNDDKAYFNKHLKQFFKQFRTSSNEDNVKHFNTIIQGPYSINKRFPFLINTIERIENLILRFKEKYLKL